MKGAPLTTIAPTTLLVNSRHVFAAAAVTVAAASLVAVLDLWRADAVPSVVAGTALYVLAAGLLVP